MKKEIINLVMHTLRLNLVYGLKEEFAKNFCKLILDSEGIAYQEEDFNSINYSCKIEAIEIVKKYAQIYKDQYIASDRDAAWRMELILWSCDYLLGISSDLNKISRGRYSDKPESNISTEKGETINLENEGTSDITSEKEETVSNNNGYPFAVNFYESLSDDEKEEILDGFSAIYKVVRAKHKDVSADTESKGLK